MTGGASSARKGSKYERETVRRFLDAGWGCIRLAASGSGGDADLPDVLAGQPVRFGFGQIDDGVFHPEQLTDVFAIELKAGKATTLYVDTEEVAALEAFARRWGARGLLGARFTTQGSGTETWLLPPDAARGPTDGGRYGLPQSDIAERATWVVTDEGVRRL